MSTRNFYIEGSFDFSDPEQAIKCVIHSGDLSYDETKKALIRFRDHLTVRIEAGDTECPLADSDASLS